ncbi:hypothetical protein V6N13_141477 [Hibiscus sabdariffa]|uniref:Uncharacterized protein n=2 Tax=Hibiscus sabdariffa TaxID=183260 RepID=A0ABR2P511_9ROSI
MLRVIYTYPTVFLSTFGFIYKPFGVFFIANLCALRLALRYIVDFISLTGFSSCTVVHSLVNLRAED